MYCPMVETNASNFWPGPPWADSEGAGGLDPLKNHKNIGFPSNTGPDPLINHKATKSAFIGTPAKRHLNVVSLAV